MTSNQKPTKLVAPIVAAGVALLLAGLIAWLWLGEWRFAVTGVALLVLSGVIDAAVKGAGAR